MAGGWHIGVIGGSGLYDCPPIRESQEIHVNSPFGQPSGPVTVGSIAGVRFTFLARHGEGHQLNPAGINYRANIDVMKRCGVTDIVAISAVGSLREEMAPGHFVAADQFIDRTEGRARSFFGNGLVAHVALADPVCPRLSSLGADAVEAAGGTVHRGGCYIAIEGPQFSTRAESRLYRAWGADVIGMTAMPEARLAREAELPYAIISMITDYDSWRDEPDAVVARDIVAAMHENTDLAKTALVRLAEALPPEREASPIDRALDGAILTDASERNRVEAAHLDAITKRINL